MQSRINKQIVAVVCVVMVCLVSGVWSSSSSWDAIEEVTESEEETMCPSPTRNTTRELELELLNLVVLLIDLTRHHNSVIDLAARIDDLQAMLKMDLMTIRQAVDLARSSEQITQNKLRLQELDQRMELTAKQIDEHAQRGLQIFEEYEAWNRDREKQASDDEASQQMHNMIALLLGVVLFTVCAHLVLDQPRSALQPFSSRRHY